MNFTYWLIVDEYNFVFLLDSGVNKILRNITIIDVAPTIKNLNKKINIILNISPAVYSVNKIMEINFKITDIFEFNTHTSIQWDKLGKVFIMIKLPEIIS